IKAFEIDPFKNTDDYDPNIAYQKIREFHGDEERAFDRHSISKAVEFIVDDPVPFRFIVTDISEEGMLLESEVDISPKIQLVGHLLGRRIGCITVWSRSIDKNLYSIGIEFLKINLSDIHAILSDLTENYS